MWEISKAKATKVFNEKLEIDKDIMIERAHRIKRNYKINIRSVQEQSY